MQECLPRGRSVGQRSGAFSMNVWIVTAPPIVKNQAPFSSCVNNSFKLLYFEILKTFEFERDVNGDWHPVVGKKPVPPLIISESFTGIYKAISRPDILFVYIFVIWNCLWIRGLHILRHLEESWNHCSGYHLVDSEHPCLQKLSNECLLPLNDSIVLKLEFASIW